MYGMNNLGILKEIGRRIKQKRLEKNISQKEIAEFTGLSRSTISDVERGNNYNMITFIQILRGLKELDQIDLLLPAPKISPLELVKLKGKARLRASGIKKGKPW